MHRLISVAALAALTVPPARLMADSTLAGPAAESCAAGRGSTLAGVVQDATGALIPQANVTLDGGSPHTSGSDGQFHLACVRPGQHTLTVAAPGFSALTRQVRLPHAGQLAIVLAPATVQVDVTVNGDTQAIPDTQAAGTSVTVSGKQLQALADDPDDLQRQLQQMAAASGGNPANTTLSVDGFQGSSKLPPKSSIAYIKINPDPFSAEYREPPFEGGRVEVYTKPGQKAFHGDLYANISSPWMNASDPYATSKAPLGKQTYRFDLSGPVRREGSDFSLSLKHRAIQSFGVLNATSLDSAGNPVHITGNVATPQDRWIGEARMDWQLGTRNTLIATYTPDVETDHNVGVGGLNLAATGYTSGLAEHTLRFTDVTTLSTHLMHEARVGLRWNTETDVPVSTAPQVQVAGAFVNGGNTLGPQRLRRFNLEVDDDAIFSGAKHTAKFGTQLMVYRVRNAMTSNFNGTYTFGGSDDAPVLDANGHAVPGETETITGVEQYRRALLSLPGGAPTAFNSVAGTPEVQFAQIQDALYVQDDWNVGKGVHLATGLRYFAQNNPTLLDAVTPRAGVLWSPTKKGTWTLHAHAGLFVGQSGTQEWAEILREDGTARQTRIGYNPAFCPALSGCDPYAGATPVSSYRTLRPTLSNMFFAIENVGGTRMLPGGWNLSMDYYVARLWNLWRTVNVNSPLNGDPNGPRALGIADTNILQVQNSAQGRANLTSAVLEQHSLKRLQMVFGGVRLNLVDDDDDSMFNQPQSAFSDAGEFAHRSNQPVWNLFGNFTLSLPEKLQLSCEFNGGGEAHYNITTGFDNNGDGDFNDRPQYAAPGTPGAVQTRYGLLVSSGGIGVFGRNQGVMPWKFYVDPALSRVFTLTRNAKAEHQQTLNFTVRFYNVLNHTNVTAVGGVLGSPTFGQGYLADNGRHGEASLMYSF